MIFEYEKPTVEVIDFEALERLARDAKEARDGENGGSTNIGGIVSGGGGWEEW